MDKPVGAGWGGEVLLSEEFRLREAMRSTEGLRKERLEGKDPEAGNLSRGCAHLRARADCSLAGAWEWAQPLLERMWRRGKD